MKFIKLECKSAGFQYGDTAEIGKGEGKISEEAAVALVEAGLAKEIKEAVASSGNTDASIAALKVTVKTLSDANTVLATEKEVLEAKIQELTEAGDEALQKQVEELSDANTVLAAENEVLKTENEALKVEIAQLKGFLDEAIDSAKGKVPAGYVKG